MALGLLRLMDGPQAVVVQMDSRRRAAAMEAGAIAAVDPRTPDAKEALCAAMGRQCGGDPGSGRQR